MTTPTTIVVPSKAKTITALIGTILTVAVPLILQVQAYLPPEWQAVIGGILGLLTVLGVYSAPYKAAGTVIVPVDAIAPPPAAPSSGSTYTNPWT